MSVHVDGGRSIPSVTELTQLGGEPSSSSGTLKGIELIRLKLVRSTVSRSKLKWLPHMVENVYVAVNQRLNFLQSIMSMMMEESTEGLLGVVQAEVELVSTSGLRSKVILKRIIDLCASTATVPSVFLGIAHIKFKSLQVTSWLLLPAKYLKMEDLWPA
jgi:hypothetical protein